MKHALDRYTSFLASQLHRLKEEKKTKPVKSPFITISRQTGAGGISLGLQIIKDLKKMNSEQTPWLLLDQNLVKNILKLKGMPDSYLDYMEEKKVSEVKDVFETLLNLHPPAFSLVKEVSEAILHLAEVGHTIIVGRGANILTRKLSQGIHIRLIGSVECRVQRVMKFYDICEKEALEKIHEDDQGRKDYIRQNFNQDIDDPLLYDFVMNTDSISLEDASALIIHAMESKIGRDSHVKTRAKNPKVYDHTTRGY